MKKLFALLFSFLLFLFLTPLAHADNNFSTSLQGTYAVQTSGNTHATFSVSLKNLTDRFYASSYALQLGFADIEHIRASDLDGNITPILKKTADGQEITFALNHRAIGLGAVETLTFSFDTTNVATHNGSIWEVNIPGLQNDSDFTNFSVQVVVPPSFGPPVYLKPDIGNTSLTFTKDQLGKSGISLSFGQKQIFHFNLSYHLKNTQLFPVRTQIALPPNTSYQDVSIDSINPKPTNVTEDSDGNWLAEYALLPSQVVTVHVDGRAFLSLRPKSQPEPDAVLGQYLKPTTYWQATNNQIVTLAQQLKTPYAIYEYVVKTLHYDFARVNDNQERLGAVAVLQNPSSAVCLEFTDLFIALARAAGIPAREIDGFAYTQNSRERPLSLQKDILHAWPEYYDKDQNTWVMVDPTWENTTGGVDYFHTFDYDHVAFVIKGQNPDFPIPAGGYKLPNQESQDVSIDFASDTVEPDPTSTFDLTLPPSVIGGLRAEGSVELVNTGTTLFPSQQIAVSSSFSSFPAQTLFSSDVPPYGKISMPIHLGKTAFLTNQKGTVTIALAGKQITKPFVVTALSLPIVVLGGIIIVILIISLFIITRRSRRIPILR